jgi:hypothetical protein
MQVWVLEVKNPNDQSKGYSPWLSYIAKHKWMLESRLRGTSCLLTDKEIRIVKYTLTKKKGINARPNHSTNGDHG